MIKKSPITEINGIGEKTAKLFNSLGIETLGDIINYYPRSYDYYDDTIPISELEPGRVQAICGEVVGNISVTRGKKVQITSLTFKDLTGRLRVTWFRMPYIKSTMSNGGKFILRGLVLQSNNLLTMSQPEIFTPCTKYDEKKGTLMPKYTLTKGLTNNAMRKACIEALNGLDLSNDYLPKSIKCKYNLTDYETAIRNVHFPKNKEEYSTARNRLVFDEFLKFIISLRNMSNNKEKELNHFLVTDFTNADKLISNLPYKLTDAQHKVLNEIFDDLKSSVPMSRLVQGDVGSGKTILAVLTLISVCDAGYQGALMAPTEVLAKQHYFNIVKLLNENSLGYKIDLLTGSMSIKEKKEVYARLESGETDIVIGTHAVIQDNVLFNNLGIVITDEQHRFGVKQRETLAAKGNMPHILVMSATPIPRTLAIILYGDLSISILDEMPSNRLPIKNCVVDTNYRKTAYKFMKDQVALGRQCYVICPMVEESESIEAENVIDYTENLKKLLGKDIRIEFLHGKMKQSEKDSIMNNYKEHNIDILVSTTVIEVGIDVPNATFIMIENAERFGLAGLHQLRGRVGRGKYQSYCVFMAGKLSEETKERLNILNNSNDGFEIANEDLRLRGPGDLFGIRQSGLMNFKLADVFQDSKLLHAASHVADELDDNVIKIDAYNYGSI
ncbi:MAG: ATP-dependent DNA helicase RecG [Suipraeoptans sp.]